MIILVANIKGGMARTTVSVMLARAFSQTGKRVTLVDATASGDSVRYVQRMQEKHNLVMPFEVDEFLNNPFMEGYDPSEGSAELRAHIQSLRESMNDGIVVVDTNSHHEDTLRALDPIADHVVVPYDYSPASFEPTLRTLASFRAPTTVLPHRLSTQRTKSVWNKSLRRLRNYQVPSCDSSRRTQNAPSQTPHLNSIS